MGRIFKEKQCSMSSLKRRTSMPKPRRCVQWGRKSLSMRALGRMRANYAVWNKFTGLVMKHIMHDKPNYVAKKSFEMCKRMPPHIWAIKNYAFSKC